MFCDSRAVLEDRIRALRETNKYNIHTDRHIIGLPRILAAPGDGLLVSWSKRPSPSTRAIKKARRGCSRAASIVTVPNLAGALSKSATS
jgi:hypothetical protein